MLTFDILNDGLMDFEDSDRLDTPDLQIYITDAVEAGRKNVGGEEKE